MYINYHECLTKHDDTIKLSLNCLNTEIVNYLIENRSNSIKSINSMVDIKTIGYYLFIYIHVPRGISIYEYDRVDVSFN